MDGVLDKCTYKTHAVSGGLASQATPLLSQAVLKLTTTIGAGLGIGKIMTKIINQQAKFTTTLSAVPA